MPRTRIAALAVLAAVAVTSTACSTGSAGHGSTAPTTASVAPTSASGTPTAPPATPTTTPSSDTSATPSSDPSTTAHGSGGQRTTAQAPRLDCTGSPLRLTDCLGSSLAAYWLDHAPANQQPDQVVYLQIPTGTGECAQAARTAEGPFTCTADLGELYFPPSFQKKLASWFGAADLPYAYASVLSHEYGHYLQLDVHDPNVTEREHTRKESQALEQQADCLSGVWAHDAAINHHYDAGRFNAVASELLRRVSSNAEIYSHGTPDERIAALDRGLGTGRPSACGLAGLH